MNFTNNSTKAVGIYNEKNKHEGLNAISVG